MQVIEPEQLERLRELCRKHRVTRLDLFGSAASGDFDPARSDLDFLVEFERLECGERASAYFGLLHDLEALFGRPIDLGEPEAIRNPYLRASIESSRVQLYAAA